MDKILIINGSPKQNGNTALAIEEFIKASVTNCEVLQVGHLQLQSCKACGACRKLGKCAFDDVVNEAAVKLDYSDALIVASPVHFASASGAITAFMDRLFYSSGFDKRYKIGAAIAVARRGGITSTFDQLNKYFTISGMPIASGQYWNGVHGAAPGEASQDLEGLQQIRTLAQNVDFLIKSIKLGLDKYGMPQKEDGIHTNFVR
ncbi:MAG: flavodoxin family protein [Coriobacteriia bacterium]|nr:flavodoxin family protein [Coriobacteriia bacterium]